MSKALGSIQRRGSARGAHLLLALTCTFCALLLSPPIARADEIGSDGWARVTTPTKAQCDAAPSMAKPTALWIDRCADVEGLPKALPLPKDWQPTAEQQQLAWDAEKECSGKTFEDAKDHDAFQECLAQYKADALLALAGSLGDAVRAACEKMTGETRVGCVDDVYISEAGNLRSAILANQQYVRLKEWGDAIERELAAHPRQPIQIVPLAAVPQGQSADPKSTITGIGYGQDTGQDYGQTSSQDIRDYDSGQQAVVGADGRKVDIRSLIGALQQVSPQAAKNPFVVSTDDGTLTFSPEVERVLTQQSDDLNKVGGVELNVTFQNLALLGVPDMRVTGSATLIENPTLISLKRLVAAAKPYTDTPEHWRKLPENIRYPGSLGRVHGYVLDPAKGDVFIVGTAAKTRETRLDIDVFTVLTDVVWSKGLVPSISLDPPPRPADLAGPQSVRIINLPTDALVTRIMLDADYQMKRIGMNLVKVADASFKSAIDILKVEDKGHFNTNRFWFHPTALNPDSVRVGGGGRVVLHDAGVQVLTEQMEGGYGTGQTESWAFEAAAEFTKNFPRIETSDAVKPAGIFGRLHGIIDIVTMYKILRDSEVGYPVLNEFRQLPYHHLTGAEAIPYTYPGLAVSYRNALGSNRQLKGGVQLRVRQLRRALDRFEDKVTARLMQAAEQFEGDGFAQTVPLSFRLAIQSNSNNAALLAMQYGLWFFKNYTMFAQRFELEAAIKSFADAAAADPTDTDAWAYLALANALAGRYAEARSAITHAQGVDATDSFVRRIAVQTAFMADPSLRMDTVDPIVRSNLSNAYVEQAETDLQWNQQHKLDDVFRDADLAVKWWPDNPLAYVARGRAHEYRDDPDAAMRDYNKAIELAPNGALGPAVAQVYAKRARLFDDKKEKDRALQDYTQAIRLDPNPEFLYQRASIYKYRKGRGDYDRAIADLTEAIRLGPIGKRGNMYYDYAIETRSDMFKDKGFELHLEEIGSKVRGEPPDLQTRHERDRYYDLAIQDYNKLVQLRADPKSFHHDSLDSALDSRGDAYYRKEDYEHAIADFTEAIRLSPSYDLALKNRAETFRDKGDFDRAIADYNEWIRLQTDDYRKSSGYSYRAKVWEAKGDLDRAIADYTQQIRLDPAMYAYANRAKVEEMKGDFDAALADYNQIVNNAVQRYAEKDPYNNRASAYRNRALFWKKRDNLDRALSDFDEAIRLTAGDKAYFFRERGEVHEKRGEHELAMQDSQRAAALYAADGRKEFLKGDFKQALGDLSNSIKLVPDTRLLLLRQLSQPNRDRDRTPELAAAAAQLTDKAWPYPVVEFYLGQRSENEVLSMTATTEQRCEAQFFIGGWHLLHDDSDAATSQLQTVIDTCPKMSDAYLGATAVLKQ